MSGGGRDGKNARKANDDAPSGDADDDTAEKPLLRPKKGNASYAGQEVPVSRAQGCAGATRTTAWTQELEQHREQLPSHSPALSVETAD